MKRNSTRHRAGMALGWTLAGMLVAGMASAQESDGPPPPIGRPSTVAGAPLALLDSKLKLTSTQQTKIAQLQSDLRQQHDALRPGPRARFEGGPPDWTAMLATREKLRAADDAASQKITAVLTDDQRQSLPGLLSEIDALRADGIPLEVYGDLKLSADQEKQLTALGTANVQARKRVMDSADAATDPGPPPDRMRQSRQETDTKVRALLSASQRATLDKFQQDHPRRGPGGPGGGPGFGPPPDGYGPPPPGFGPPPDGMGPPPPDGAGPPPPGN